jgi:hypothetical protein
MMAKTKKASTKAATKKASAQIATKTTMTLNEYLSKHNRQRVLDTVIKKWYLKKNQTNPLKEKKEWDEILKNFHNETE